MLFAKEFRYWIYRRLSDIVLSLSLVFWLRDYHALAFAMVASSFVTIFYSYAMSSYRPWFSFTKVRALWSVSQWIMIDHGSQFIGRRVDEFVIGGISGSATVGNYYMASEISAMPTREVVLPAERALIPTYSKVLHDETESRKVFLQVFGLIVIYALPAGIGISVVAPDLVPLLLGGQWTAAIPFFQWLGVYAGFAAIFWGVRSYFLARGGERTYALASLGYACVLVPAIVAAGNLSGPMAIAMTRTGLMFLMVIGTLLIVDRMRYAPLRDLLALMWRPALASAAMWAGVFYLPDMNLTGHVLPLIRDVGLGMAIFVGLIVLLWLAAGRPDGPERNVMNFAVRRARQIFG